MNKALLHLSVDQDFKKLAKESGLNLSKEFEEWIKIRLGNIEEDKPIVNTELEIAKHQSEIQKLKSQAEIIKTQEMKDKEEIMIIDDIIENERTIPRSGELVWEDIATERSHGIQFLFKKKFNKNLNPLEAKELLLNRLKEKGLC